MPKLKTLAEAYGSETAFTKALARNPEWLADLYDEVNFPFPMNMNADDEVATDLGKRVDVVVYDGDTADCVIECQDQSGVLDPIHASKVTYYMSANGVDRGILLCDTAPNETKTFIREQNMYMPRDIAIVSVRFLNKEPVFTAIEVPFDRKTRTRAVNAANRGDRLKAIAPMMELLSSLTFVEPIAPSDTAAVIKLNPKATKWSSPDDNILIIPQKTRITLEVPSRLDPESLFPELVWNDHQGANKGIVMKSSVSADTNVVEFANYVYEKVTG